MIKNKKINQKLNETLSSKSKPFVFLETAKKTKQDGSSYLFKDPEKILICTSEDDIDKFFKKIKFYQKKKYWLAGFFSYEFGYFLEPRLKNLMPKNLKFPLAWFGVFKSPYEAKPASLPRVNAESYQINNLTPSISEGQYSKSIKKIKQYLQEGQTYQVNYTFGLKGDFSGNAYALYSKLKKAQPTSYMAFINTGSDSLISSSPELFLKIKKRKIQARPMKGTVSRGCSSGDDLKNKIWLKTSLKNKAENVMIVDLLRNDLGRISEKGSVKVSKLFTVEKYPTVFQMTSSIEAKLKKDISFKEIIQATFPCGSVTGAPKIRTMQIIRELEKNPRNIYTGSIGFISPQGESCFNVAIRTIHIDKKKKVRLGIGGGIVYDSSWEKEYQEALLKSKFLTGGQTKLSLIETFRWDSLCGYNLFDLHLKRLSRSCKFFKIKYKPDMIKKELDNLSKKLKKGKKYKIRALVDLSGNISLEYDLLKKQNKCVVMISKQKIEPKNIYLYHKTTNRGLYEEELKKAKKCGLDEVLFKNKKNELTEGSFTNIFLLKEKILYTPPISCGLLPGVLRQHLLDTGKAKERVLREKDLFWADKIYLGNSVRGLIEAKLSTI